MPKCKYKSIRNKITKGEKLKRIKIRKRKENLPFSETSLSGPSFSGTSVFGANPTCQPPFSFPRAAHPATGPKPSFSSGCLPLSAADQRDPRDSDWASSSSSPSARGLSLLFPETNRSRRSSFGNRFDPVSSWDSIARGLLFPSI